MIFKNARESPNLDLAGADDLMKVQIWTLVWKFILFPKKS